MLRSESSKPCLDESRAKRHDRHIQRRADATTGKVNLIATIARLEFLEESLVFGDGGSVLEQCWRSGVNSLAEVVAKVGVTGEASCEFNIFFHAGGDTIFQLQLSIAAERVSATMKARRQRDDRLAVGKAVVR